MDGFRPVLIQKCQFLHLLRPHLQSLLRLVVERSYWSLRWFLCICFRLKGILCTSVLVVVGAIFGLQGEAALFTDSHRHKVELPFGRRGWGQSLATWPVEEQCLCKRRFGSLAFLDPL